MKCKLGFIASAVAGGLVEGGEERVGAHACGGGGEARLLGMGHRHTGHDVFLWILSHDDGLSTPAQICSLETSSFFSNQTFGCGSPWVLQDPVALEIRFSILECLETFSQRSRRRPEAWHG